MFLSVRTKQDARAIGVEYDERIYKGAADNKELAVSACPHRVCAMQCGEL